MNFHLDEVNAARKFSGEAARRERLGNFSETCHACGTELWEKGEPGFCPGCGSGMNPITKLGAARGVGSSATSYQGGSVEKTPGDLLRLRNTGMTNYAIAKAAHMGVISVDRMIGKTPPELIEKAKAMRGRNKKNATSPKAKPENRLEVKYPPIEAKGMCCKYIIEPEKRIVNIKPHGSLLEGIVNYEEMRELIAEFTDIVKLFP